MKNKFLLTLSVVFFSLICFTGCEETDENTGDSTLSVNAPAVTLNYGHGSVTTLVETDATYAFSASIAEPVEYDVVLKVDVLNATATQGEDFDVPNEISIAAGSTTASGIIEIFADDAIEDQESFTLSIGGRTINGDSNSAQATFNIANLVEGDLAIGLDWAASSTVTDNSGNEISPYALADLRLLLTNVPYTSVLDGADGGVAELYTLSGAAPDGEYYMVADYYTAMDIPADLDLTLTFDQVGVINGQTHSFPAALFTCPATSANYFIMAKITKSGTNYTFEEIGENAPFDVSVHVGSYTELSDSNVNDFLTEALIMTLGDEENELIVEGIYEGLFTLAWGEVFQPGFGNEGLVSMFMSEDNSIVIPEQYMGQTLPGPYDYWMAGDGSYDPCANAITLSFALYFDDTYAGPYQPAVVVVQLD